MKKEIRKIKEGIVQITMEDERYYEQNGKYYPSNTWILSSYPKNQFMIKWIAEKGYKESQDYMKERGKRGSKIHQNIQNILEGATLKHNTPVMQGKTDLGEMDAGEWKAMCDFVTWWKDFTKDKKVKIIAIEESYIYKTKSISFGTTVDLVVKIDDILYVVDWKTSKSVFETHKLQLTAMKKALVQNKVIKKTEKVVLLVVQVGYTKNKKGIKVNEAESNWNLFKAVYTIFMHENKLTGFKTLDLPVSLKL